MVHYRMLSAIALATTAVTLLSGCIFTSPSELARIEIGPDYPAEDLPARPPTATLTSTDPTALAAELAEATSDQLPDVGAGWLAAYAVFDVPVIDSRVDTAIDDPVGPSWSKVWSIGQISRGMSTVPLDDVASVLSLSTTPSVLGSDGAELLAALRSAALSPDPRAQTFSRFIAAKSVASGWADPLDPNATSDQVGVDAATLQLTSWVVLREALLSGAGGAAPDPSALPAPAEATLQIDLAADGDGVGSGKPCSEAFGSADATSWINWVNGKLGNGIGGAFDDVGLPPLLVMVIKGLESIDPLGPIENPLSERVGKGIGYANAIAAVVSLLAQVNALKLDTNYPETLVRVRAASDGGKAKIGVLLTYDFKLLNIDNPIICALTFLVNTAGVGLSIPQDGARISGAEILTSPGENMPEKVYFGGPKDLKFSTDADGRGEVNVLGHARKKALPKTAKELPSEFGVYFSAQVEEVSIQSILNTFIDGLQMNAVGVISSAVDVAKTLHYRFDDPYIYPYTDYESGGWRVDEVPAGSDLRFTATICDLDQPFTVFENEPGVFTAPGPFEHAATWDFTPAGNRQYTVVWTDYFWDENLLRAPGLTIDGSFPASVVPADGDPAGIRIPDPVPGLVPGLSLTLIPDPSVCDLPADTRVRPQIGESGG